MEAGCLAQVMQRSFTERLIGHALRTAEVSGAKAVKYLLNRLMCVPPGTALLVERMIANLKNLSKGTEDRVP